METKIRKIGNSSGIIIPKALIDKYELTEVSVEDNGDGIIIRPLHKSYFQSRLEEIRKNKSAIYSEMENQAALPDTKAYYEKEAEEWGNVDTEIIE